MIRIKLIEDSVVKATTNLAQLNLEKLRNEITSEINAYPIIVDNTWKQSTSEEKELLKRLKKSSSKDVTYKTTEFRNLKFRHHVSN